MKGRALLVVVCSCILIMNIGCDMFMAPFGLIKELLPIAIKYAPYALMFLEAPADRPQEQTILLAEEMEVQLLHSFREGAQLRSIDEILQHKLQPHKKYYILAIHLQTVDDLQKLQTWMQKTQKQFHIEYHAAICDLSTPASIQNLHNILGNAPNVAFLATGPLHTIHAMPQNFDKKVFREAKKAFAINNEG